jgi:hypothetical protein
MYYVLAVNPRVSLFSSSLDTTLTFNILFHCYSLYYRFSHNTFQLLLEISETSTNTHTYFHYFFLSPFMEYYEYVFKFYFLPTIISLHN